MNLVFVSQAALDKLPEYSMTNPSGAWIGKQWKTKQGNTWYLREYVMHPDEPGMVVVKTRKIRIRESRSLQAKDVWSSSDWHKHPNSPFRGGGSI